MADIVDKDTRSRMMAGIRGKDTRPELALRRALRLRGIGYRLHAKGIIGRPDLVLKSITQWFLYTVVSGIGIKGADLQAIQLHGLNSGMKNLPPILLATMQRVTRYFQQA